MIEKMARAICKSNGLNPDVHMPGNAASPLKLTWEDYIEDAKAALSALKEPTKAMIEAGALDMKTGYSVDLIYTSMIEATEEGK